MSGLMKCILDRMLQCCKAHYLIKRQGKKELFLDIELGSDHEAAFIVDTYIKAAEFWLWVKLIVNCIFVVVGATGIAFSLLSLHADFGVWNGTLGESITWSTILLSFSLGFLASAIVGLTGSLRSISGIIAQEYNCEFIK